jgi:hypothetical protein
MLADKDYRKKVVDNITDPSVRSFWVNEYAKYTDRFAAEAAPAIQNKIGQFIANPLIRNIIGQPKSSFDIRKMMDERKILVINLSKGRMGETNANLLGSMLITKIYLAAMSRADASEQQLRGLPNFYLYVDEFQNFANESFADILSEARKYKLNLTVAHQYIEQMSEEVRAAVFGNVGTMIVFRVGAYDAEVLEKEFAPQFTAEDLVNLGFVQIYLKLMIDGVSSSPFSATTLPPIERPIVSFKQQLIESSRKNYAKERRGVEEDIKIWHQQAGDSPNEPAKASSMPTSSIAPSVQRPKNEALSQQSPPPRNQRPPQEFSGRNQSDDRRMSGQQRSDSRSASRPERNQPQRESRGNQELRNRPSRDSRETQVARETELRKAISLDHLKPAAEVRNDKKIPTEKNLSELREALLSVMGEAFIAQPTKIAEEKKSEVVPEKNDDKKEVQPKEETLTSPPTPKEEVKPQEKKDDQSKIQSPLESKQMPREVPEEVLRKILEI